MMNKNEERMLEILRENIPVLSDLKAANDQYSRYDAVNDKCYVELKYRHDQRDYDTAMIEKDKFNAITGFSKNAVYVMWYKGKMYVWNLTKLINQGYDFNWHYKDCPKNTYFGGKNDRKNKYVGDLYWEDAHKVIECDI